MNKILIIGQAPPAVEQTVPYDTTMLYDMLEWAGISKDQAQSMFEFEAMTATFPGHRKSGHKLPTELEMDNHFDDVLRKKIQDADKILILGSVASNYLLNRNALSAKKRDHLCFLLHPSKRNYSRITADKFGITEKLKDFLNS